MPKNSVGQDFARHSNSISSKNKISSIKMSSGNFTPAESFAALLREVAFLRRRAHTQNIPTITINNAVPWHFNFLFFNTAGCVSWIEDSSSKIWPHFSNEDCSWISNSMKSKTTDRIRSNNFWNDKILFPEEFAITEFWFTVSA